MNNNEAKFILHGYRTSGADADDPVFEAALEQATKDPALSEWFSRQQAFDQKVSAALQATPVPASLREAILAGGSVSTTRVTEKKRWWTRAVPLALAASVAIVAGVLALMWPKQSAALQDFILADARLGAIHGGHGHAESDLQVAVNDPAMRLGGKLPLNFASLRDKGCRVIQFHGRDIAEACFNRNGVWFHCYVGRAADFPAVAIGGIPAIVEAGASAVALWSDGEHVVFVVSKAGANSLRSLL